MTILAPRPGQFEHITGPNHDRKINNITHQRARELLKIHGRVRDVNQAISFLKAGPGRELNVTNGTIRWVVK